MSRIKLQAAKELIKEKRYWEARTLLMTIRDDPTAARWIGRLDEIIAGRVPVAVPPAPPQQTLDFDTVLAEKHRPPFSVLIAGLLLLSCGAWFALVGITQRGQLGTLALGVTFAFLGYRATLDYRRRNNALLDTPILTGRNTPLRPARTALGRWQRVMMSVALIGCGVLLMMTLFLSFADAGWFITGGVLLLVGVIGLRSGLKAPKPALSPRSNEVRITAEYPQRAYQQQSYPGYSPVPRDPQAEYIQGLRRYNQLGGMPPDEFEGLIGNLFRRTGYLVEQTGKTGDEGVDLVLKKAGKTAIVQCKRYSGTVSQSVVRDLYGAMVHNHASSAYLVTTGTISLPAQQWAQGKPIHLVDGSGLIEWIDSLGL